MRNLHFLMKEPEDLSDGQTWLKQQSCLKKIIYAVRRVAESESVCVRVCVGVWGVCDHVLVRQGEKERENESEKVGMNVLSKDGRFKL